MKKYLSIVVLVGVVVIGFGYYSIFSTPAYKNVSTLEESQEQLAKEVDDEIDAVPMKGLDTLQNIAGFGQSVECSIWFDSEENGMSVEGTYFVAGDNIRGDFLTPTPDLDGQMVSSIIIMEDVYYVWSEIDGEKYGAKMNVSEMNESTNTQSQAVAMDERVNYECSEWKNVDNTVFLPPSDVLFYDMNEMFESGMEYGTIYEEGGEF